MNSNEKIRNYFKTFFRITTLTISFPIALATKVIDTERSHRSGAELVAIFPGIFGEYLRSGFYKLTLKSFGDDCCISFGTTIGRNATIGSRVYVGSYSIISNANIGDDALLASRISVISGMKTHGFSRRDVPIREQEGDCQTISIGKGAWIGEGAIIGADVGEGTIIGAGSLVTKPISDWMIAVGSPAEVVAERP